MQGGLLGDLPDADPPKPKPRKKVVSKPSLRECARCGSDNNANFADGVRRKYTNAYNYYCYACWLIQTGAT